MKDFKVGLQLYSVRGDMEKDMDKTLAQVKEMGYDYVEFAGYYGHSAEDVRAMLDKHGLTCISVHQVYSVFLEDAKTNIEYLKTIGAKYCAMPWMGLEKHAGHGEFEKTVQEFVQVGSVLKENGIQLLYHNHEFEFESFEGKYLLDWLYDSVPEELLKTQLDTCWVKYAGEDPCAYLKKYAGRSPVVHLKDFVCDKLNAGAAYALIDESGKAKDKPTREENHFDYRPLGDGLQDIPAILAAAEEAGAEYVIVEQDEAKTATPLESVRRSREYLKSLGL